MLLELLFFFQGYIEASLIADLENWFYLKPLRRILTSLFFCIELFHSVSMSQMEPFYCIQPFHQV
jgi:hypothetical protein